MKRPPLASAGPHALAGDGVFNNAGTVAVAVGSGIQGNLLQTAAGALDIELQGPGAFDQLKVTRAATLDGTLHLFCHADCSVSTGQSFTLLDAAPGQLQGLFANVVLSGFGRGAFELVYDRINGDVLLNVLQATAPVPEPSTGLLLATGLLALAWRRRQGSPSQ